MRAFSEDWNGTALIEAPTGHSLSVSPLLFTDHKTGKTKIDKEGRSAYVLYLAKPSFLQTRYCCTKAVMVTVRSTC